MSSRTTAAMRQQLKTVKEKARTECDGLRKRVVQAEEKCALYRQRATEAEAKEQVATVSLFVDSYGAQRAYPFS